MSEPPRGGGRGPPALEAIQPGTLSALLREMVAIPEDSLGVAWQAWLVPGAVIGRFELVREIGRGGFGVVWEARDRELNRSVAFKAVRAGMRRAIREERLLAEAEAAARLSHPNLVTLYDVGRTEHGPYLVLELLEGQTLAERLGRGAVPLREALRIAFEVARGVAHAHAHGVFHRDLKPGNVMLCRDGRVKVLDFGLAHAFGWRYQPGGTPAYMAPEQAEGAPEDERADVYALGAILHGMLSGEQPEASSDKRTGRRRRFSPLDLPDAPELADLVARMLDREAVRRPRDGAAVLSELEGIARGLDPSEPRTVTSSRARRRPWVVVLGAIGGIVLGAVGTGIVVYRSTPHEVGAEDRLLVAVADFANETRDPDLDGLSGLLITSLEQSHKLRVLTRARLMDLVRETRGGEVDRVDESLARMVGRKAGVRALFLASIRKLGDTYAADLRALDPQSDEYLFTLREVAGTKNDLLPLIDRISDRARIALREPSAEVRASELSIAEAVTPSLEAYRHYFRGKELAARGSLTEAVPEYERAVAIAPRFAMAKLEIAWVGYLSGWSRAASHALVRQASSDVSRLPDKEAGLLRGLDAFFSGRFAKSRAELHALFDRYTEDQDVALAAAEVLTWCGEVDGVLPAYERALELAPEWDVLRVDQVQVLYSAGRGGEALARADEAATRRRTPFALAAAGLARYLAGDIEGGVEKLRAAGNEPLVRMFLAQGLAARGSVPEALASLEGLDGALPSLARAQVLSYAGRLREGVAEMDRAAQQGGDIPFNRQATSWYLSAAGDLAGARRMASQGDLFTYLDGIMLFIIGDRDRLSAIARELGSGELHGRFLRALSLAAAGDRAGALGELRSIDRGGASFIPFVRGQLAAEEGLDQEAVDCLARFDGPLLYASDAYQAGWLLARARYLGARSLERLGRREEARKIVDLQLERYRGADPDLPLVGELRALRSKLAEPPPKGG